MEIHDIEIVEIIDTEIYKGILVSFIAKYKYCKATDELTETEEMFRKNVLSMKESYAREIA